MERSQGRRGSNTRRGRRLFAFFVASTCLLAGRPTVGSVIDGTIDTYVGGGNGDGAAAIDATIDPHGLVAVGPATAPNFYIADAKNNRVRRVDGPSGVITTIAGTGGRGYSGDGGSALNAMLSLPLDVAVDAQGNAYIADTFNNRIRKVTPSGVITTFAGNGSQTFGGDGGLATQASLYNPYGVAVGPDGNVYIADFGNNRIRKVSPPGCSPTTCVISTVAGNGNWNFSGDNGPATAAALRSPADIAFDGTGKMYIADWGNQRIRRVTTNGTIATYAGGGVVGPGGSIGDGGIATAAVLNYPIQIALDTAGNLLIADSLHYRVRMVQAANQTMFTVAGTGTTGTSGDGGPAIEANLYTTYGVAAGAPGDFWLSQSIDAPVSQHNRVRQVLDFEIIDSVVGGGLGDGGAAIDALVDPRGATTRPGAGSLPDLYFADGANNVVRRVDGRDATIYVIAGTGEAGYGGDGGLATNATLRMPLDVAVATDGTLYVADTFNNVVRKIAPSGTISTVAGTGAWGYSGDDGPASRATLASPRGVALDLFGNLYIADYENSRVRMVTPSGTISTVAGNGTWGYGGDGGAATAAKLRNPWDVVVGTDGSLFIADTGNHRVRRVDVTGVITTYAGNGSPGFSGDFGAATAAKLYSPVEMALDAAQNLYIADSRNYRIRRVDAVTRVIQTIAGSGQTGVSGDGGSALAATFSDPTGVAIDALGNALFVASKDDARVRLVLFSQPPQPTATFTATSIPPTSTRTPTPTFTSIPPTNTRTSTRTATPTNTGTPTRTGTATATWTRTPTVPAVASLDGHVTYYSNAQTTVPGVDVALTGPASQTITTGAAGDYAATNILQGTWSVEPRKTGDFGAAVSSLDAARVLQAVAQLYTFSDLQRLACDVTGDGTVTALDATRILQFSAGILDQFPVAQACGSDWLFIPVPDPAQNQSIVPPSIGGGSCQPGGIIFNPLVQPASNQDFSAILFGDCTGNWTPSSGPALRQVARRGTAVHAGRLRGARAARVRLPLYVQAGQPFQALDVTLRYDAKQLRLGTVRLRGGAAGALLSTREDPAGVVTIAVASAEPIAASDGAVLLVEFTGRDGANKNAISLARAAVDEQPARLVTHR